MPGFEFFFENVEPVMSSAIDLGIVMMTVSHAKPFVFFLWTYEAVTTLMKKQVELSSRRSTPADLDLSVRGVIHTSRFLTESHCQRACPAPLHHHAERFNILYVS